MKDLERKNKQRIEMLIKVEEQRLYDLKVKSAKQTTMTPRSVQIESHGSIQFDMEQINQQIAEEQPKR